MTAKLQTKWDDIMKIRIVSNREEIVNINGEIALHLAYRPSNKDVMGLVKNNPGVKAIQLPKSYMKTVSESIKMYLEMQGIKLLEGDVWGHRKDINPYFDVSEEVIKKFKDGELKEYEFKGNVEMIKAMM